MQDSVKELGSWALMAIGVVSVVNTICMTLIVQWALTGRVGLRRRPSDVESRELGARAISKLGR